MDVIHTVEAAGGDLRLRAEQPSDQTFLKALFAASRTAPLLAAGVPQPQIDMLIDMQHRGQSQGYRGQFPAGRFWIVERDGQPVGRLVEDDEAAAIYVVDIAVASGQQRRGVARALIADTQARAAAAGRAVRALVAPDNIASLALFGGMGFNVRTDQDNFHREFIWP